MKLKLVEEGILVEPTSKPMRIAGPAQSGKKSRKKLAVRSVEPKDSPVNVNTAFQKNQVRNELHQSKYCTS